MLRKIGRYEILGPLATGGMAEIHLARLAGPSGFERAVVIKRVRTDLNADGLTSLFLQEARLAAKIRHANVVNVEDLGTDEGGVPYLVMEYLEGESVSNLSRRLVASKEKLPIGLAAFIIAEACAGLHAAHELRNHDGDLLGLVHRDVSPQNLFVTYAGAIKVVDFGLAKTAASTTTKRTTEQVRGKFSYMAPEQFKSGEPVDRRTDIFSLGIMLYELTTSHRLFKRFTHTATMRAVLSDPIVPPSRVEPSVPPAIEAICLRALTRSPAQRYASAAEMRRELLAAMRDLVVSSGQQEEPSAELSVLMTRLFAHRIEDKRSLLRNVREGSVVSRLPPADVDAAVELPAVSDSATGAAWVTSLSLSLQHDDLPTTQISSSSSSSSLPQQQPSPSEDDLPTTTSQGDWLSSAKPKLPLSPPDDELPTTSMPPSPDRASTKPPVKPSALDDDLPTTTMPPPRSSRHPERERERERGPASVKPPALPTRSSRPPPSVKPPVPTPRTPSAEQQQSTAVSSVDVEVPTATSVRRRHALSRLAWIGFFVVGGLCMVALGFALSRRASTEEPVRGQQPPIETSASTKAPTPTPTPTPSTPTPAATSTPTIARDPKGAQPTAPSAPSPSASTRPRRHVP